MRPVKYILLVYASKCRQNSRVTVCTCNVGTMTTVQLTLSGIRLPFGLLDTVFEDLVAQSLHQVLTFVSSSLFFAKSCDVIDVIHVRWCNQ